jgi:hypothetical protein
VSSVERFSTKAIYARNLGADQEVYHPFIHRVFVTEHSRGFLEAAAIHEFSIIDTVLASKDPENLADIISREWLAGSLRGRQPFVARISADGSVTVNEIEG